jgi:hypothetical protein
VIGDRDLCGMVTAARKNGESESDIQEAIYENIFRGAGMDFSMQDWSVMRSIEILKEAKGG